MNLDELDHGARRDPRGAILVLEDGRTFRGESFGAPVERSEQTGIGEPGRALPAPRSWRLNADGRQELS